MFLADVIGTVVSPVQHPILDAETLLLLRPVTPDGEPTGKTRVGLDRAQASGSTISPVITRRSTAPST